MRQAIGAVAVVGWMSLGSGLYAQTEGRNATIRVAWAEVRGNRSELFPVTGMLCQGQAVRITPRRRGLLRDRAAARLVELDRGPLRQADRRRGGDRRRWLTFSSTVRRSGSEVKRPRVHYNSRPCGSTAGQSSRSSATKRLPRARSGGRSSLRRRRCGGLPRMPSISKPRPLLRRRRPIPDTLRRPCSPIGQRTRCGAKWRMPRKTATMPKPNSSIHNWPAKSAQPNGDHDLAIRCYNRIEQLRRAPSANWPARQPGAGNARGRPTERQRRAARRVARPAPCRRSGIVG